MSLDTLDLWVDCKMKMDINKTKIESKEFNYTSVEDIFFDSYS